MLEVKPNFYYKHKKTGNTYLVLGLSQVKCMYSGTWLPAVIYYATEERDKTYIRTEEDFMTNFEEID